MVDALRKDNGMDKMTSLQASTLCKARMRMLEIKNNFRNMYPNNMCCMYQQEDNKMETQRHIMEKCLALNPYHILITEEELFSDDFD